MGTKQSACTKKMDRLGIFPKSTELQNGTLSCVGQCSTGDETAEKVLIFFKNHICLCVEVTGQGTGQGT